MNRRRVVITGLGAVCPLGNSVQEAWDKALRCADRIVTVNPTSVIDVRDRGLLYLRLEHHRAGAADLKRYLALAPHAEDRQEITTQLTEALANTPRLH